MNGFTAGAGREVSRYVRVDLRESGEGRMTGHAPVSRHLCGPDGAVRTGALLTFIDNVGGICGGLAALPDGWVVSTNLAARVVNNATVGPVRIDASVLRRGRNSVVTAVQVRDEGADDVLVADGVLTSAILVPENGPPQWERPVVLDAGAFDSDADAPPLEEWMGVRAIDAHGLEIALADELRNPWGILHGGVVASLVDLTTATSGRTTDVVLHFLAPNRIGPVRATATVLGTRSDGDVCRVEVRDIGADRVTAVAVVTARE
ncbi:MAG TPA: PaaI family thioesterase [Acidimicrobiia bacterium]|nr:PaaI family thioesterase [Acidimicrobiia bacterium]